MTKAEFDRLLNKKLKKLPKEEVDRALEYYDEIIADKTETGMSEEEAIEELGTIDEIVTNVLSDIKLSKIIEEKIKPKKSIRVWEIILLILGAPVWLPILITAFVIALVMMILFWLCVIIAYAVFAAVALSSVAGLLGGIVFILRGHLLAGLFLIGAGITCGGLSVLLLLFSNFVAKAFWKLSKVIILGIKRLFVGKDK